MSNDSDFPKNITITINANEYAVSVPERGYTLLDLIRDLGFTGAKFGCGVGQCGACTVVMNGEAVTSCTISATKADGAEVTTIEGISDGFTLHPIQQAFVDLGAVQCGYCTPGFIMRLYALFTANPDAGPDEIREAIEKNICRCTGYESIVAAAETARGGMD